MPYSVLQRETDVKHNLCTSHFSGVGSCKSRPVSALQNTVRQREKTKVLAMRGSRAIFALGAPKMATNGKETRETRSFTARLAVDTLDILQQLANEDDRSLAYMVQKAIDEFAAQHGPKRRARAGG